MNRDTLDDLVKKSLGKKTKLLSSPEADAKQQIPYQINIKGFIITYWYSGDRVDYIADYIPQATRSKK